jgi:hypothetical protein
MPPAAAFLKSAGSIVRGPREECLRVLAQECVVVAFALMRRRPQMEQWTAFGSLLDSDLKPFQIRRVLPRRGEADEP